MLVVVLVVVLAVAEIASGAASSRASDAPAAAWPMAGLNLHNTRHQATEAIIGPDNVGSLVPRWVFTTGGDVSATPAVVGNAVYVPDWGGNLVKLDASTGQRIWSRRISEYTHHPGAVARVTPAVEGARLFLAGQNGAHLMALHADTGNLIWITRLDTHPAAIITQSPVVADSRVYVGVSSLEEAFALDPDYPCCTFRGSVASVDARSGAILWQTYLLPENQGRPGGYAGNAVWGSTPVVDTKRNTLYVTTGNNYDVPQAVKDCEKARQAAADPASEPTCIEPGNHVDAVVALDLATGQVKWSKPLQGYDAWTFVCLQRGPRKQNCPDPRGPDYDFGQGPMLFTAQVEGTPRELLGAGQKSGIFWALDPDTGAVVWSTVVGPGGYFGGMQWGSATDGERIYVALANSRHRPYTLVPSGMTVRGGSWGALDAATGAILWQTPDPVSLAPFPDEQGPGSAFFAIDTGPVTVANGVVYAGSMDREGHMYALDAPTGRILWTFKSGGSVNAGPAVVNGVVYWGSGYSRLRLGSSNNKLYAFEPSR
jgi:polyvinyl alcohol dehydrogenase (cytochrome)